MSKKLADRFERDLSAPEETAERARQARSRGAALDVDWERAMAVYYAQAKDPKRFIRFPNVEVGSLDPIVTMQGLDDISFDDDERYESTTSR